MNANKKPSQTAKGRPKKKTKPDDFPLVRNMDEFKNIYLPREAGKATAKDLPPQEAGELFAQQSLSRVREILSNTGA